MNEPTQEKPIVVNSAGWGGGHRWTCVCGVGGTSRSQSEDDSEVLAAQRGQWHLEKYHQNWIDTKGAVFIHPRVKRSEVEGGVPRFSTEPVKRVKFVNGRYGPGSALIAVMSWLPNDPKSFQLWGDFYTASDAAEFGRTYFPHRHRVVTLLNPRSEADLKTIPAYREMVEPGRSFPGRGRKR